jgi:hypothetical protein
MTDARPTGEDGPMRLTGIATAIAATLSTAAVLHGGDAPRKATERREEKTQIDTPLAFKDAGSEIILYIETDRRHVAAFDPTGRILWHRDVVKEDAEKIKNTKRIEPVISRVSIPQAWELKVMAANSKPGPFAGISFYNGSSGVIDLRTGELAGMRSD